MVSDFGLNFQDKLKNPAWNKTYVTVFAPLAETSSDAENAQASEAAPTAAAVVILVNEGAKALRETNF